MRADQGYISPIDILIAYDDGLVRKSLRSLLEREGYRCAEAENGREAVDLARRHPPRCVFLDLAMPDLDGFNVARELSADERTSGIPIHCLTGLTGPGVRQEAGQAGCELFLTKPVDVDRLLEVVHTQLRRPEVESVTGLTLAEAHDLLDALENQGFAYREVTYSEEAGFGVHYGRLPPGTGPAPEGGQLPGGPQANPGASAQPGDP